MQDLCVFAMTCHRAPIYKKNIIVSFNHLYNTIMSLKDFDNIHILFRNILILVKHNKFIWLGSVTQCNTEIEYIFCEMFDWLYSVQPEDLN